MTTHWCIIANANSVTDLNWIKPYLNNRKIIICDGAYNKCSQWLTQIDYVLGDFDSVNIDIPKSIQVYTEDQNKTDLQKAIEFADKQGAASILIVNALGSAMDHTLHNLRLLKRFYNPQRSLEYIHPYMFNDQLETYYFERIVYLQDQSIELHGKKDQRVSLFGFPQCIATSHGLQWDLDYQNLTFADMDSSRNCLVTSTTKINIQGAALVILENNITIETIAAT